MVVSAKFLIWLYEQVANKLPTDYTLKVNIIF